MSRIKEKSSQILITQKKIILKNLRANIGITITPKNKFIYFEKFSEF